MELKEGEVYRGRFVTRLDIRQKCTKEEATELFTKVIKWSKEKVERNIELIYSVSLEELEEEALCGIFIGTGD